MACMGRLLDEDPQYAGLDEEEANGMSTPETIADILAEMRNGPTPKHRIDTELTAHYADLIQEAIKDEAAALERIVRDAVIDYSEQYVNAPNDDVERELKERAAKANAWLAAHGFKEEHVVWSKEEAPCL